MTIEEVAYYSFSDLTLFRVSALHDSFYEKG